METSLPERNSRLPQIDQESGTALSVLQQQFNAHLEQIARLKETLAQKRQQFEHIQGRVLKEIRPLVRQLVQKRIAYIQQLDQAYETQFLRHHEREKLCQLILEFATALLENYAAEAVRPLHEKYTALSYNEEAAIAEAEAREQAQATLKNMLGLEVDLDDLQDLDSLHAKLDEQMRQEQEKREAQRANRQKSKNQQAQETKAKVELQNIGKATRRLYTHLVKLLHPDKEMDSAARLWKEEAMKNITIAYHHDDFFELLRLQMEYLPKKELHLTDLPDDQLTYYVQMLAEQVKELENELERFASGGEGRLLQEMGGSPKQMELKFRRAKNQVKDEIKHLSQDMVAFQDPDFLREYLKTLRF